MLRPFLLILLLVPRLAATQVPATSVYRLITVADSVDRWRGGTVSGHVETPFMETSDPRYSIRLTSFGKPVEAFTVEVWYRGPISPEVRAMGVAPRLEWLTDGIHGEAPAFVWGFGPHRSGYHVLAGGQVSTKVLQSWAERPTEIRIVVDSDGFTLPRRTTLTLRALLDSPAIH